MAHVLTYDKVNKIITVPISYGVEITIQNLLNDIRDFEDELSSLDIPKLTSCAGKEPLGGGVVVGLTLTLLDDWQLAFEARSGPSYIQCTVSGGNIVATNSSGSISPTAFTQVLITASSSATQSDLDAIQYSSYGGGVSLDIINGTAGTSYPIGNQEYPVDNLADAITIANSKGFKKIYVLESMTGVNALDSGNILSNFILEGRSHIATEIEIAESLVCDGLVIKRCSVSGTLDGGTEICDCIVGDLVFFNGHIYNSGLKGVIELAGNEKAVITKCSTINQDSPPSINMGGSGQSLALPNYSGIITITNLTSSDEEIGIGLDSGMVTLDSTITAGTIIVAGVGLFINNTTGTANVNSDGLLNRELITKSTWDIVYIDTGNGVSGTSFPIGTLNHPVNNISDALIIASNNNIIILMIEASITITTGQDISNMTIKAERSLGNIITVNSGAITAGTYFENLTVSGVMSGSVRYTTCVLGAITNFDGGAKDCLLTDDITLTGTGANYLTNCDTYITSSTSHKTIDVSDKLLNIIRCRGDFEITNQTGTQTTTIDLVAGEVILNSSCTSGSIWLRGIGETVDNSGAGCIVIDDMLSAKEITTAVVEKVIVNETNPVGSVGEVLENIPVLIAKSGEL